MYRRTGTSLKRRHRPCLVCARGSFDARSLVMSAESDTVAIAEDSRSPRRDVLDHLLPIVYDELRAMAHRHLAGREKGGSLATTGLVHEAYLKLVDQSRAEWVDRTHFFALSSVAM